MAPAEDSGGTPRQGILLAAAMFVFVIDTSFMNVSISAVVEDLDTTVSGVQSAVAIEALVSAAFILISSKIGDLFGRKRAFVLGMLFYAVGALAMVFAQGLTAIIVFWAVLGGLGASLYLPAMQSLIHGNFEGKTRAKVFALVGASGAIAAAIGPLVGGFVTTLLSWRVGFMLEALIIGAVLLGSRGIRDVPYAGDRSVERRLPARLRRPKSRIAIYGDGSRGTDRRQPWQGPAGRRPGPRHDQRQRQPRPVQRREAQELRGQAALGRVPQVHGLLRAVINARWLRCRQSPWLRHVSLLRLAIARP